MTSRRLCVMWLMVAVWVTPISGARGSSHPIRPAPRAVAPVDTAPAGPAAASGEAALEQLRERGLYESLAEAMVASRYGVKAVEGGEGALVADNEAQSADFVTKYKAEQGVITLPSGIMYRIAKAGTGAKPTANSEVQIAFRSFLGAVGVPLSGVQTPPAFKVSDAPIPALKETLPLMAQGTVWEVVIPPGKGLGGAQNQQFAKQAVAMQIELGAVK